MHNCRCAGCDASVLHGLVDGGIWEERLDLGVVVRDRAVEDALHRLGHATYNIFEWSSHQTEASRRFYNIRAQPGWEGALCDMTYRRTVLANHKCGEKK